MYPVKLPSKRPARRGPRGSVKLAGWPRPPSLLHPRPHPPCALACLLTLLRLRLRRMARRARATEESLTVDKLLAKADAAEATAAAAATESRAVWAASAAKRKGWLESCAAAKRRALTADGAIEWVGERSWAERDAELRRHAVPLD
jgi:hypothetical protein